MRKVASWCGGAAALWGLGQTIGLLEWVTAGCVLWGGLSTHFAGVRLRGGVGAVLCRGVAIGCTRQVLVIGPIVWGGLLPLTGWAIISFPTPGVGGGARAGNCCNSVWTGCDIAWCLMESLPCHEVTLGCAAGLGVYVTSWGIAAESDWHCFNIVLANKGRAQTNTYVSFCEHADASAVLPVFCFTGRLEGWYARCPVGPVGMQCVSWRMQTCFEELSRG